MRHNKFIGWDEFLGLVEKVERLSPWLSRQLTKHASEWPFWMSGLVIDAWTDERVTVRAPLSRRNSLDGEISHGHLALGAELTLRALLLRYRGEFPFRYGVIGSRVEIHHKPNQDVIYRFGITRAAWEELRLDLMKTGAVKTEFVFPATLADGRSVATFTFTLGFALDRYLPA